jgi:membrane protein
MAGSRSNARRWWAAMRSSLMPVRSGALRDQASGLTYYGLLSLFPGLLVLVSILGLVGGPASRVDDAISRTAPGQVGDFLRKAVDQVAGSRADASLAGVLGLLLAFWSASGYMAAFIRATAAERNAKAGPTLLLRLGMTAAVGALMITIVFLLVLTGDVARRAGQALGIGSAALAAWNVAKWPVLVVLVAATLALLYRLPSPGERLRWVTPGSVTAVLLWIVVSAAFGVYLATLASYQRTYGALSGLIVFLVWLWLTNIVVLLGARLDLELRREC